MKKVGNHKSFLKIFFSLALSLSFSLSILAQDPAKGKEIFNANCAACHKLDKKSTGPALRGVADKYDKEWLHHWIKDSPGMIKSGDATAVKVFEENGKVPMTAFPQLSEEDIDNILAYTSEPAPAPEAPAVAQVAQASNDAGGISNNVILGALTLILIMLIVMLFIVNNVLTKIAKANNIEVPTNNEHANMESIC